MSTMNTKRTSMHSGTHMISRRAVLRGTGAALAIVATAGFDSGRVSGVPATAVTYGRVTIRGKVIGYRAEAGETVMRNAHGVPRATIFSVSYLAQPSLERSRPVTFIFNGGPGGATWSLREALAPCVFARGSAPPGFAFVDNSDSLFDVSDLVFIDAPGTGYSQFLSPAAKPEYWGIQQDARAVSQFIQGWLRSHRRIDSPKYILGESYGGTRTGQILEMLGLRRRDPILFSGVILISPSLGGGTQGDVVAEGPFTVIPSEAVAAWYHHRGDYLSESLEVVAANAQRFATGPYADYMKRPHESDRAGKLRLANELSSFIGIAPDKIIKRNLAVPTPAFRDLLLADKGLSLNEDSREVHPLGAKVPLIDTAPGYDLNEAIIAMIRDKLGYKTDKLYVRDPTEAHRMWNNAITTGRKALPAILQATTAENPDFRIFLAGGYFDLIIPYLQPLSGLSAAHLPASQFTHRLYRTGHAVLNDVQMRSDAVKDVREFYRRHA